MKQHFPDVYMKSKVSRILPLGDSITAGAVTETDGRLQVGGGYRWPLWQLAQADRKPLHFVGDESDGPAEFPEPFHEGHLGTRSDEILRRLPRILVKWKPDIVLLMIGTNDLYQNKDPQEVLKNIEEIVDMIGAQKVDTQIFVSGPIASRIPRLESRIVELNAALDAVMRVRAQVNKNLHFLSLHDDAGLIVSRADYSDDLHPSDLGYQKIARAWYAQIAKDLEGP